MLTVIKPRGEATIKSDEQKSLYNFMLLLQKFKRYIYEKQKNGNHHKPPEHIRTSKKQKIKIKQQLYLYFHYDQIQSNVDVSLWTERNKKKIQVKAVENKTTLEMIIFPTTVWLFFIYDFLNTGAYFTKMCHSQHPKDFQKKKETCYFPFFLVNVTLTYWAMPL